MEKFTLPRRILVLKPVVVPSTASVSAGYFVLITGKANHTACTVFTFRLHDSHTI